MSAYLGPQIDLEPIKWLVLTVFATTFFYVCAKYFRLWIFNVISHHVEVGQLYKFVYYIKSIHFIFNWSPIFFHCAASWLLPFFIQPEERNTQTLNLALVDVYRCWYKRSSLCHCVNLTPISFGDQHSLACPQRGPENGVVKTYMVKRCNFLAVGRPEGKKYLSAGLQSKLLNRKSNQGTKLRKEAEKCEISFSS